MLKIVALVGFAALMAVGQILFKKVALSSSDGLIATLFNPWLIAALAFYAIATVLWVWILSTTPLSLAYPFAALGFVFVPLAAWWVFGESLSWSYAVGVALIVAGVIVTQA